MTAAAAKAPATFQVLIQKTASKVPLENQFNVVSGREFRLWPDQCYELHVLHAACCICACLPACLPAGPPACLPAAAAAASALLRLLLLLRATRRERPVMVFICVCMHPIWLSNSADQLRQGCSHVPRLPPVQALLARAMLCGP